MKKKKIDFRRETPTTFNLRKESKRQLAELGVRPSKERGQNFLVSDLVIDSIIEFGRPQKSETIVEIGPGLGALTAALMPYGLKAVIEIESAFAASIKKQFPTLEVFEADARSFDFSSLGKQITIFSNLPYSISSEMLLALVRSDSNSVKRIVLMLQKEFVERLAAEVSSSDYGILSVFCQRAASIRTGPVVGAEYFQPRPKIDSQLIELVFNNEKSKVAQEFADRGFEDLFSKVVRAAFSKRRKTLLNSLQSSGMHDKGLWERVLEASEVSPGRRAQTLNWIEYENITATLIEQLK